METRWAEEWRRFKETGLADLEVIQMKRQAAASQRLSKLEKELFQHHQSLKALLIEKQDWCAKCEQLNGDLSEAREILKRDQLKHTVEFLQAREQVESLEKAVSAQKQLVLDYQRTLRYLQDGYVRVKDESDAMLADARTLVDGTGKDSLDVEGKMCSASAKLAELNLVNIQLDRKLQAIESRRRALATEQKLLKTERELHRTSFINYKQELNKFDNELDRSKEMLIDVGKSLNCYQKTICKYDEFVKPTFGSFDDTKKRVDLLLHKCRSEGT